ncbi:DUF7344 domain-containing protein [Halegenticoccus soli]
MNGTPIGASDRTETPSLDVVCELLARPRRQLLLETLTARTRPISERDLAARVAARERDRPPAEIPSEDFAHVFASIHHTHLPKLRNAGVVSWDATRSTVRLKPSVDPSGWGALGEFLCDPAVPARSIATGATILATPERRAVLSALHGANADLPVNELANRVAALAGESENVDMPRDTPDRVLPSLHHRSLPKLAALGAIKYDREAKVVALRSLPVPVRAWLDRVEG